MLDPDDVHAITNDVARSLWLNSFADACDRARDEEGHDNAPHPGAGGDWADIVPVAFPQRFHALAARLIGAIPLPLLSAGWEAWRRIARDDRERFAHVLTMGALGHGVGLFDDVRTSCFRENAATAQDRADADAVRRLREAVPSIGESCDLFAAWNPETGQVE